MSGAAAPKLSRDLRPWLASAVLLLLAAGAAWSHDPDQRMGRVSLELAWAGPSMACPSGYDRNGRCVLGLTAGGVHSFLWSGVAAALIVGVVGSALGLLAGHPRSPVRSPTRALMSAVEALPRLVMLIMVFVLWDHNPEVLGLALGLLLAPTLASEIQLRLAALEQSDFLRATRAHGVSEWRVVWLHCLYLSCRGEIVRRMFFTFGQMVMMDTALSYVLQDSISRREVSWGLLLRDLSGALYDSAWQVGDYLQGHGAPPDLRGLAQVGWMVVVISAVVWAVSYVGEGASQHLEAER